MKRGGVFENTEFCIFEVIDRVLKSTSFFKNEFFEKHEFLQNMSFLKSTSF